MLIKNYYNNDFLLVQLIFISVINFISIILTNALLPQLFPALPGGGLGSSGGSTSAWGNSQTKNTQNHADMRVQSSNIMTVSEICKLFFSKDGVNFNLIPGVG